MTGELRLKACIRCFAYIRVAAKTCVACGGFIGDPLKSWRILSRNERAIEIDGRHYFAARCNLHALWKITEETDAPESGKARLVGDVAERLTTADVTAYFRRASDKEYADAIAAWKGGAE